MAQKLTIVTLSFPNDTRVDYDMEVSGPYLQLPVKQEFGN